MTGTEAAQPLCLGTEVKIQMVLWAVVWTVAKTASSWIILWAIQQNHMRWKPSETGLFQDFRKKKTTLPTLCSENREGLRSFTENTSKGFWVKSLSGFVAVFTL